MGLNFLGLIPARGGSKRLPGKNLAKLGGVSLLEWTIRAALDSTALNFVAVSTEAPDIAKTARACGVNVLNREMALARDDSSIIGVLQSALLTLEQSGLFFDAVVLLQPTSPFRTAQHIVECTELFSTSKADTLISVHHSKEHPYYQFTMEYGQVTPFFDRQKASTLRHELPIALSENGAVVIYAREVIEQGLTYGKTIVPYIMKERDGLDIDTSEDLLFAQFILDQRGKTA